MTAPLVDIPVAPQRVKPTREQALAIAEHRKAARRTRTSRIRRAIAVVSVAAFIGPFGVIYTQLAAGHDPALAGNQAVSTVASTSASDTTKSASGAAATKAASTSSVSSDSSTPSSPAAVTTQQS